MISSKNKVSILKAKLLEMGSSAAIFAQAMDQSKLNDIANTILILIEMGDLLKMCNNEGNDIYKSLKSRLNSSTVKIYLEK